MISQWFFKKPSTSISGHSRGENLWIWWILREVLRDTAGIFGSGTDPEAILGFEKNPWCMVYNSVIGRSKSNPLFSPGPHGTMTAHAYSKPFGGRIGPWYGKTWPRGANQISRDRG